MNYFDALFLGVIQGITEFLPISSSGHLIILREILGLSEVNGLAVDALLQLATALAVVVYFMRDFVRIAKSIFTSKSTRSTDETKDRTLALAIIIGTIPAVFFGLILENAMETVFRSTKVVAGTLLFGSLLMVLAEKMYKGLSELTVRKGFVLGLFQALALLPGVSRSGATISGGMILGLTREDATKASFMFAVPILVGSGLKKTFELFGSGSEQIGGPLYLAFFVSFFVGIFVIRFLLRFLKTHTLYPFVYYRIILAIVILLLL